MTADESPSNPDVSAVIVSYNSAETIRACLESVLAAGVAETIVVDNASSDGTPAIVRSFGDRVKLIESGGNLGFGRGANVGAAAARSELIALINPDATTTPGAIATLVRELRRGGERLWAVGPALLNDAGEREYSARGFPSVRSGLVNRRWLDAFPRSRHAELRRFLMMDESREASFEADWLSGAFLVVRRRVFDDLGGFDPGFFLYYEEVDLFRRARDKGFTARFVGEAVATHSVGGSSRKVSMRAAVWRIESFQRYFRKHLRRGFADDLRFWSFSALGIGLEAVMIVRRLLGRRRPHT